MATDTRAPFDAAAIDYDAVFTDTCVGRLQRERVWQLIGQVEGEVLELNCGTGEDAIWLAQNGCRVLATDASEAMLRIAEKKIRANPSNLSITLEMCRIEHLEGFSGTGFDLILSNFGGLNCVPPETLPQLGQVVTSKLRPGGRFVAIVMGRFCWWETLYFLIKGQFRNAFRRLGKLPVSAPLGNGSTVQTWYYTPGRFRRLICCETSGYLEMTETRPVGFWLPPSYLDPFFRKHPRFLSLLGKLENAFSGTLAALAADHFLISFTRKPEISSL